MYGKEYLGLIKRGIIHISRVPISIMYESHIHAGRHELNIAPFWIELAEKREALAYIIFTSACPLSNKIE